MTKPRLRYRANGTFDVLTHDGYVPLVPVSGDYAPTSLESVSPSRMSLIERPVFIGCHGLSLAFGSNFLRPSQNLAEGFGSRSLSIHDQHAGVLSHEDKLSRFHSHGREK